MRGLKPDDYAEPFFITKEVEAELVAMGHEFEPPPICTGHLRDMLESIADAKLVFQPGAIAD